MAAWESPILRIFIRPKKAVRISRGCILTWPPGSSSSRRPVIRVRTKRDRGGVLRGRKHCSMTVPMAVQGRLAGRPRKRFTLPQRLIGPDGRRLANLRDRRRLACLTAGCVTLKYRCFLARSGKLLFPSPFFRWRMHHPRQSVRPKPGRDITGPARSDSPLRRRLGGYFRRGCPASERNGSHHSQGLLRRSYRDQQANEWKHTHVLGDSDLLPAAEALKKCFEIIEERRKS